MPVLDPNVEGLPDSSLVDFGHLLDGPCGKRGFLFTGRDGNFYFEDGTRGRFWGINVAKDSVFQPPERIDEAIETIARAGFNLVRLHHIDGVTGLLPAERAGTEEPIDPEKLAAIDHWIAECGRRGIYIYLDLLDFRTFHEREGVPAAEQLDRGAKPYAVFNERLIELQMDYARALLVDHVNPETELSYANDPTVCMVEICDENGLFLAQRRRQTLISPYREELQRRWNYWLRTRYEDTEGLRLAWTDWQGRCALLDGESLEEGTVTLHGGAAEPGQLAASIGTGTHGAGRINDLSLFLASVHGEYFTQMRDFLRERSVRVPITAVSDFECVSDLRSVYESLDFVGTNYYYDHPRLRDNEWRLPMYFINHTPLGDPTDSFAPKVTRSAFSNRPVVVREWGVCWPNKFRGVGMMEAIAYAALQDVDAMILFTYDLRPEARRLSFFDVSRDPTRWGLAGVGAQAFLRREIDEAKRRLEVGYSYVDSFFRNGERTLEELYRAGHVTGVRGRFFDDVFEDETDLIVASGLSSGAAYLGTRAVISAEQRAEDLLNRRHEATLAARSGYDLPTAGAARVAFEWGGTLFDPGARSVRATHPGFSLQAVEAAEHLRPIGVGQRGQVTFGVRDMRRANWVYHALEPEDKLRAALDALGQLYDERICHDYVDTSRFVSDTRQIVRDEEAELLAVNTPTFQAVAGALENAALATGRMSVRSDTPIGAVCWLSLDGRGPEESRRWVLKMVTIALNTGEEKSLHVGERERAIFSLEAAGEAPVITLGEAGAGETMVSINGRELARVGLVNGSWELARDGDRYYFWCDTPGATLTLPEPDLSATAFIDREHTRAVAYDGALSWPAGARLVVLR
ncbi:MAG: hypothetical protein ACP5KN_09485 [Armatimonadota bacterium]